MTSPGWIAAYILVGIAIASVGGSFMYEYLVLRPGRKLDAQIAHKAATAERNMAANRRHVDLTEAFRRAAATQKPDEAHNQNP